MIRRLRGIPPLAPVILLSAALAVGFAAATPVGGAPDERAHLRYVQTLATEVRLPVLSLQHRREVGTADQDYEAHQPPLYYSIAAPFYLVGRALAGETGGGQGVRLLSILLGVLGTTMVWRLARHAAPDRPALALAAAAFTALLPMRLAVMASVTNDGLAEVLSTTALLHMVALLRARTQPDPISLRTPILLGLTLGLALLTKATAILLLPPALLALYLGSGLREEGPDRLAALTRFLRWGLAVGVCVGLLAGWWFVRNRLLYGDPLAQRVFNEYFADTPHCDDFRQPPYNFTYGAYWARLVFPTSMASFWGAFGHLNQPALFMGNYTPGHLPEPWGATVRTLLEPFWPVWDHQGKVFIPYKSWLYPLLILSMVASLAGPCARKLASLLSRRRPPSGPRRAPRSIGDTPAPPDTVEAPPAGTRLVLAAHAVFVVAAFLNFNATYFQGQGRYLLPAIGAISLGLCGGWLAWSPRRPTATAWGVVGIMALLATYALFGVVVPGFHAEAGP